MCDDAMRWWCGMCVFAPELLRIYCLTSDTCAHDAGHTHACAIIFDAHISLSTAAGQRQSRSITMRGLCSASQNFVEALFSVTTTVPCDTIRSDNVRLYSK